MGREGLEAGSLGSRLGGEEERELLGPIHGAVGEGRVPWPSPKCLAGVVPWNHSGNGEQLVEPRNRSPGGRDTEG